MDHNLMLDYLKRIVYPYATALGKKVLLLWDAHDSHWTDDILLSVKENGHEVVGIPPRCTSYLQPLDVSVNAPFKAAVKDNYEQWIAQDDLPVTQQGNIKRASYDAVLNWVNLSIAKIDSSTVTNAFVSCGISNGRNECEFNKRLLTVLDGADMSQFQTQTVANESWWESDGDDNEENEFDDDDLPIINL